MQELTTPLLQHPERIWGMPGLLFKQAGKVLGVFKAQFVGYFPDPDSGFKFLPTAPGAPDNLNRFFE